MLLRFNVLAAILRNSFLRRLEVAFLIFASGEWSTWVAVIVYAYGRGGAAEAGVVVFAELAPSVVLAPAVAALGDRFPRDRVLLGTYAAQAVLMAATAAALAFDAPALVTYPLAIVVASLVALSRPIHAALMPEVVTSPDDLTAANVVSGMAESAGSLIGPLGAGLLIGLGGPAAVFAVAAIGNAVGAVLILSVARGRSRSAAASSAARSLMPATNSDPEPEGPVGWRETAVELTGGLRAIRADPRLRAVVLIATWATLLVGAMDILYAVLAIDLMGLGGEGVGFVGALGGVGAIIGSVAGLLLVGRERLGIALAASAVLFGVAIAAIAMVTGSGSAAILLIFGGAGSGLTSVGALTLIHRLAGDDVMSRVFGVLQGLMMGATALGALAVPVAIAVVGNRTAFAIVGLSLPIVLALVGRAIVRGDKLDVGRAADLRLLRAVPMLAPLSGPILEQLGTSAGHLTVPAGTAVVREGDAGDRFYVVASGHLDVTVRGRHVGRLAPGAGFGEIALLRDVPRTATVTAIDDVELLALDRNPFLDALTGQARSRTIAAVVVDELLMSDLARS